MTDVRDILFEWVSPDTVNQVMAEVVAKATPLITKHLDGLFKEYDWEGGFYEENRIDWDDVIERELDERVDHFIFHKLKETFTRQSKYEMHGEICHHVRKPIKADDVDAMNYVITTELDFIPEELVKGNERELYAVVLKWFEDKEKDI